MTDFFFRLTPDWVLEAVERGGFAPTGHCTALTCLENRVYDLRLEDGSHVIVKFYRPGRWSREGIAEEHAYLAELRESEIPVCAPLAFDDGETLHEVEGIFYAVWPRTGGRSPSELLDSQVENVGRLLARIHNVGATRPAPHRPLLGSVSHLRNPLDHFEREAVLPPSVVRRYREAALALGDFYDRAIEGVPVHRIHGDCHLGNLLDGPEGLFFLDFDDFATGPAVQDVWMLLPGRDAEGARQRSLLVDAYRQFRDFDTRWLDLVEPLRALRFVFYAGWIARRFADPAFPDAFPHFGTEEYWLKETDDLEDQLKRVLGQADADIEPGSKGAAVAEPELTNKDFFWDL